METSNTTIQEDVNYNNFKKNIELRTTEFTLDYEMLYRFTKSTLFKDKEHNEVSDIIIIIINNILISCASSGLLMLCKSSKELQDELMKRVVECKGIPLSDIKGMYNKDEKYEYKEA